MIHATKAEVHHELTTITKTQIHRTDIALHQETELAVTKILLLHNILDHYMITTKEILDPTVLLTDLLTNLPIYITLVIDIDHVLLQEITILQDIQFPIDHLLDHEILVILDLVHIQTQETNLIQDKHHTKKIHLILKYICIIQLKWQML